jgi:Leucine carboxyl methyltransferase
MADPLLRQRFERGIQVVERGCSIPRANGFIDEEAWREGYEENRIRCTHDKPRPRLLRGRSHQPRGGFGGLHPLHDEYSKKECRRKRSSAGSLTVPLVVARSTASPARANLSPCCQANSLAPALGAGLDTFAYRLEGKDELRVFEVDHPATQAEKRRRLAAAGIAPPAHLTFAPCDFEHAELGDSLRAVGFNPNRRAFLLWLGVVPYLTEKAIFATLAFVAKLPGGEVVFDYANPVETIADPASRELHERLSQRVAAAGEAFRSYFETPVLHEKLRALGFGEIEDLDPNEIAARFFPERAKPGRANGGHVVRAKI